MACESEFVGRAKKGNDMSLYSVDEVCRDCENVVLCSECESVKYCSVGASINGIHGTCASKKARQDNKESQATYA